MNIWLSVWSIIIHGLFAQGTLPMGNVGTGAGPVAIIQSTSCSNTGSVGSSHGIIAFSYTCAFGSNNTAGNAILVVVGQTSNNATLETSGSISVTDSRNSYSQSYLTPGVGATQTGGGAFLATNIGAGANTVTVNGGISSFPSSATWHAGVCLFELSNFAPTVQGSGSIVAATGQTIAITDSHSNSITTNSGAASFNTTQAGFIALDYLAAGKNYFTATYIGTTSTNNPPTITSPYTYSGSFITVAGGNYTMNCFPPTLPLTN